jgi:hypothetical protein
VGRGGEDCGGTRFLCKKPDSPAPLPAKTLVCLRAVGNVGNVFICHMRTPHFLAPQQNRVFEMFGKFLILFMKRTLRARRACITQHRIVSKVLSLTKYVGPTPSGPHLPPAIPRRTRDYMAGDRLEAMQILRVRFSNSGSVRPPCRTEYPRFT